MKTRFNLLGRWCALMGLVLGAVSSLSALTITQTSVFDLASSSIPGRTASATTNWMVNLFNGPGTLESVSVTASYAGVVSVSDHNPFEFPLTDIPSVGMQGFFVFANFPLSMMRFHPAVWASGPEVTLQPHQSYSFMSPLSFNLATVYATPADVAHFYGMGTTPLLLQVGFDAPNRFGGMSGNATITTTITYTYGVPEEGTTAIWLALGLGAVLMARRFVAPVRKR